MAWLVNFYYFTDLEVASLIVQTVQHLSSTSVVVLFHQGPSTLNAGNGILLIPVHDDFQQFQFGQKK